MIPTWLEYTNKEGKTQSRKANVSSLSSTEKYALESSGEDEKIKIGSSKVTLPLGDHDYDISYTYEMGGDPYEDYDELIFHVFGDYWGTRIGNPVVTINMPDSFDASAIKVFGDKYRKNDITSTASIVVEDNSVTISLPSDFDLYKSLTVDIELPEGYFVQDSATNNYGITSFILCILCIGIAVLVFVMWKKHGKDHYDEPMTVEFRPPNNLGPAEIGYIYKGITGRKLITSIIIQLACKGLIKIDDKSNITKVENILVEQVFQLSSYEKAIYDTVCGDRKIFFGICNYVENSIVDRYKLQTPDSLKAMKRFLMLYILSLLLWFLSYSIIQDLNPKFSFVYYIALASVIITGVLTILTNKKSQYENQLNQRIKSFKKYIKMVEVIELEKRMEDNPNYYYEILPYAYIFGMANAWTSKFENIKIPDTDSFIVSNTCSSIFDRVSYNLPDSRERSVSARNSNNNNNSSGSSGSSCGSSCSSCGGSSCGGGCSSCGGGGSW